jgi:hypothetical protein
MNSLRKLAVYGGISLSIFFFLTPQPIAFAQGIDRVVEREEQNSAYFFSKGTTVFTETLTALNNLKTAYTTSQSLDDKANKLATVDKNIQAITKVRDLYTQEYNQGQTAGLSAVKAQIQAMNKAVGAFSTERAGIPRIAEQESILTGANGAGGTLSKMNDLITEARRIDNGEISIGDVESQDLGNAVPITVTGAQAVDTVNKLDGAKCEIFAISLIGCVDVLVTYLIKNTLLQFAGFLLWLSTNLLNYIVIYGILQFGTWAPDAFYPLWQLMRQIISMFVVFSGLYLGFMYIINKQDTFKKYLPWVVVFALFVNFSYPLTRAAIDVSNIISLNIYASAVNDTKTGKYTVAIKVVDVLGEEYFETFEINA